MLGHASGPDLAEPTLVPKYGAAADISPFASSAKQKGLSGIPNPSCGVSICDPSIGAFMVLPECHERYL